MNRVVLPSAVNQPAGDWSLKKCPFHGLDYISRSRSTFFFPRDYTDYINNYNVGQLPWSSWPECVVGVFTFAAHVAVQKSPCWLVKPWQSMAMKFPHSNPGGIPMETLENKFLCIKQIPNVGKLQLNRSLLSFLSVLRP